MYLGLPKIPCFARPIIPKLISHNTCITGNTGIIVNKELLGFLLGNCLGDFFNSISREKKIQNINYYMNFIKKMLMIINCKKKLLQ